MLTSSRASVALTVWLLAHIALGAAIWVASPGAETVWFHLGRWLTAVQDADSWKPIETATARAAIAPTGIYNDVFFTQHVKLQYPLTAVTIVGPFTRPVLNVVTWASVPLTAVVCAMLLLCAIRGDGAHAPRSVACAAPCRALFLLSMIVVLSFYPVLKAYSLGQVQACLTLLFAIALLAWQRDRRAVAGIAVGLMLLVKPSLAPVLLWGAVRREWRFVLAAVLTAAVGLLVSLRQFPLAEQFEYLRVLRFIGHRGELFQANQSMNGLLNRWVAGAGSTTWNPHAFAEPNALVAVGTTLAFALLILVGLFAVARSARGTTLDLAVIGLASTLASPIAWEHHYGIVAPVLAVSWPAIALAQPAGALTGPVLFGASLVAANYFQVANRFDGTWLNPLQSSLCFAALAIFTLVVCATRSAHA